MSMYKEGTSRKERGICHGLAESDSPHWKPWSLSVVDSGRFQTTNEITGP